MTRHRPQTVTDHQDLVFYLRVTGRPRDPCAVCVACAPRMTLPQDMLHSQVLVVRSRPELKTRERRSATNNLIAAGRVYDPSSNTYTTTRQLINTAFRVNRCGLSTSGGIDVE